MNNQGGRPAVDPRGRRRRSVRVIGGEGNSVSLSMVTDQAAYLERLGGGNRSAGFRRLMQLLAETAKVQDLLDDVIMAWTDEPQEPHQAILFKWMAELDEVLEHGREPLGDPAGTSGSTD